MLAGFLMMALGAEAANFGSSAVGTTAADFLDLGAGARAIGLGGAYSAAADEATALYWNPAAMTQVPDRSATLMHAAYIASSFYDYGAYVQNTEKYGAFGFGLQYFSFGSVNETDANFNPIGTVSPYDLAASAGYAYQFEDGFALGVAGKFIQSKLADTAKTEAADFGLLSPRIFDNRLRLALTAQNLGGTLKYDQVAEPLPMTFKAGATVHITPRWLADLDVAASRGGSPYFNLGTEYVLAAGDSWRFAGRAGFSSQDDTPTFGIGVGCGVMSVDYAFVPYNDLGDVHRISLTFNFGAGQDSSRRLSKAAAAPVVVAAVAVEPVTPPAVSIPGKKQDIFGARRQLDLQIMCLRNRGARPAVATLASSVKALAGACVEATGRLKAVAAALGETDQGLEKALYDLGESFKRARLRLAQAGGCLDQLGGQAELPRSAAAAAACHEEARTGLSRISAAQSAVSARRRDGKALFRKLIKSAPPDTVDDLTGAGASYERGLAAVVRALSSADPALSPARIRNIEKMRRSVAYHLSQMPALRARIQAVALPAFPESGAVIRNLDAATGRLKLAESQWAKAGAASNKSASRLAVAMASRDTVAALGSLARARELLLTIMARVPGDEPAPLSPQDPSACDNLY
jgi:hypothetical protein